MSVRLTTLSRRSALLLAAASALPALAQEGTPWTQIKAAAKGQTVYFNAWAGSEHINRYLQWAAGELEKSYGVKLVHVKIADT
ncbi:MAG: ABC transporter substrate-binding protein, partial [Rhodoferax sp.]